MHMVSHFAMSDMLRDELEKTLQGPGVTWNLKGMMTVYDRAVAKVAFQIMDLETKERR